jgi:ribosomal protein L37AE/L43A
MARGDVMTAKAGEKAQKTGDFYCASCDEKVHVRQGDKIPECPNGHKNFDSRRNEPGNK